MSRSAPAIAGASDAALLACLEQEVLPRLEVERPRVRAFTRALSPSMTSYGADVLTVDIGAGPTLQLFVKDFSFSRLPKDDAAGRRARELHVYRDLLDSSELGTPAFYGSVWNEAAGSFLLVLEFVSGVTLRSCGFEHWVLAASWLGRLQGLYVRDHWGLEGSPWLLRHDEPYFATKAVEAVRNVEQVAPSAAPRLRALLSGYESRVETMAAEPPTLVHGNFRPNNIILPAPTSAARVCVVDWEVSALGSPLYDLALLADGYGGNELDHLIDAYRREAEAHDVPVPDRKKLTYLLHSFCLHRVVKSLSRAAEKGFGDREVSRLLAHGESLRARIRSTTGRGVP